MASATPSGTDPYPDVHIIHPQDYADHGYPHQVWTEMRKHTPVYHWTRTQGPDFWAITKHADIVAISKDPEGWNSSRRLTIEHEPERRRDDIFPPTLIQMDPPKHGAFRQSVSKLFTPRALKKIDHDIEQIGKEIVDALVERGEGECDFVSEISKPLPIAVIAWLLGVPRDMWEQLFDWTNRTIGAGDPEYQKEGQTAEETGRAAMTELFTYFASLVEERKKKPADDLITHFTQIEIDGKRLELMDVLSWCLIIMIAGNETTRNGTTGGMLAFIEHPDQMRKLQGDMSLLNSAVEEVVRWSTPIIHFARTATRDHIVRGQAIREGESVALFYPSANRDEEIFDAPFEFRIDRNPNRHLGFGIGEHFCLGAHLARLEMQVAYRHLIPRIDEVELAGPIERLRSSLVGGVKHLPIRYKMKSA